MASIYDSLLGGGSKGGYTQVGRGYSPQQEATISSMLESGLQGLGQGAPSFEPIRNKALQTFQQQTSPQVAEKMTQMQGQGYNPYIAQSMQDRELSNLLSSLSAQEAQFNQGNFRNLMSLLQGGLTPTKETVYEEGQLSPGQQGSAAFLGEGAQSILPLLKAFLGEDENTSFTQGSRLGKTIGALGGAGTGALAGSSLGPWGAAGGGLIGLLKSILPLLGKGNKLDVPIGQGPERNFL